jgi:hypothetical protein
VVRRRTATGFIALILALSLLAGCGGDEPFVARDVKAAVVSYTPEPDRAVDDYAAPGNVIIVTMDLRLRDPERIRAWREKGAIVLAYVNGVDHPDRSLGPLEDQLYGGDFPEEWLHPGGLSNWPGTQLLDLSEGAPVATYRGYTGTWGGYVAEFIGREVIGDGSLFNGVFLDVWGDRVWSVDVGGRGSAWDRGVTAATQAIREEVGPGVYLVANNTPSPETARYLNGRMFEGFDTEEQDGGWNQLTGGGETPGLLKSMDWEWAEPRLMVLWQNQADPSAETVKELQDSAQRASRTGEDIAVGASDHQQGIPDPFGVTVPEPTTTGS